MKSKRQAKKSKSISQSRKVEVERRKSRSPGRNVKVGKSKSKIESRLVEVDKANSERRSQSRRQMAKVRAEIKGKVKVELQGHVEGEANRQPEAKSQVRAAIVIKVKLRQIQRQIQSQYAKPKFVLSTEQNLRRSCIYLEPHLNSARKESSGRCPGRICLGPESNRNRRRPACAPNLNRTYVESGQNRADHAPPGQNLNRTSSHRRTFSRI